MRRAIAAGSFYPANAAELRKQIKNSFLGGFGPKGMPKKCSKKVYGVIAPHAGYIYSGQCAAWAYKAIAEAEKADTFIVLGTNHTGYAESNFAVSTQDFETPLGIVRNDKEFCDLLILNGNKLGIGETFGDKTAHQREHSIEAQLPFLQFILQNKFKIVPVICQIKDCGIYERFAKLIIESARKLERKVCIIASSDFTHYGFSYGFVPFASDAKNNLYELDNKAIDLILEFKTNEFLDYACRTTICGAGAIASAMEICKLLGSKKAELLKYYTSADVMGDYSTAVGYASISFM